MFKVHFSFALDLFIYFHILLIVIPICLRDIMKFTNLLYPAYPLKILAGAASPQFTPTPKTVDRILGCDCFR